MPSHRRARSGAAWAILLCATACLAQDRDARVRADRQKISQLGGWIYDDLEAAIDVAKAQNKPLAIVFRCIPCEACQRFDDDVARRDPRIADLLEQFVCARIVQANDLDLTRFQHDFDQSFAMTFMNADGTIYARFGTRSNRDDESVDISLEGLRETMAAVLEAHRDIAQRRERLAGKRVVAHRFKTPLDYPSLKSRYQPTLNNAEGQIARSCVHCHQVGEAERLVYRDRTEPIPDAVLFPYPNPRVFGLSMDPTKLASALSVEPGSEADRADLRAGDRIVTFAGQSIFSTADLQWVLHHTDDAARVPLEVERAGKHLMLTLDLPRGWRRRGDLSWRATTWELRRMALGGMELENLGEAERSAAGIAPGKMALRAKHVGEYDDHAVAKNAGLMRGDIIVGYDGRDDFASESALIAYGVQDKRPRQRVVVEYLRDGRERTATIVLQ